MIVIRLWTIISLTQTPMQGSGTPGKHHYTRLRGEKRKACSSVAVVLVLLVLERVLGLVSQEGACYRAEQPVAASLVAAKVARSAAAEGAHEPTITLGLGVGVGGPVALLARGGSAVLVLLALGILFVGIGALLRELLGWGLARVWLLSVLSLALAVLLWGALAVLETALCGGPVAAVLLLWRGLLAVVAGRLRRWLLVLILLVVALIVPLSRRRVALAGRGSTVLVGRRILRLLAVALVVLVVGAGHGEVWSRIREDGRREGVVVTGEGLSRGR